MVSSRLDYCNAALTGLPQATVAPSQRVQNSAARLILELITREHVDHSVSAIQLHWLPVVYADASSSNCAASYTQFSTVRDVSSVSDEHC